MKLVELVDNSKTDKNTVHSYLDLYETFLEKKKFTAKNVLEVGIGNFGPKNGGSIKLWRDYFCSANIYGLDILPKNRVIDELFNDQRIKLFTSTDAYDPFFVRDNLSEIKFDFVIDDGPHTLKSMQDFILLYSPLLTDDGILIIEDVQSIDWFGKLRDATPRKLRDQIKTYDLRGVKGRCDDILFIIDKSI